MIKTTIIESSEIWEGFIKTHPEANFLQSWLWGQFQKKLGKTTLYLGFFNHEKLIGVTLAVIEQAKRGIYMTVAGGPILDWDNKELVDVCFNTLTNEAKRHNAVFIRIRPQLVDSPISRELFKKHGYRKAPMHLTADLTSQLDITKSEDELLANMRKTTRYELKQAQKQGIRFETSVNANDIDAFYELQLQTAQRQGFVPFSLPFLKEQFAEFVRHNNALLYRAYHDTHLLAEAFVIFYGNEATYHYGASTDEGRKYPGAYLIQWEAIREAKKRGMTRYNFWGVVNPEEKNHRFYGVSVFKRGFGGYDMAYLPAHDYVINPIRYSINYGIEIVRKKVRRL